MRKISKLSAILAIGLIIALCSTFAFAILYMSKTNHFNISVVKRGSIETYEVGTEVISNGYTFTPFDHDAEQQVYSFDIANTGNQAVNVTWGIPTENWTTIGGNLAYLTDNFQFSVALYADSGLGTRINLLEPFVIAKGERITVWFDVCLNAYGIGDYTYDFDIVLSCLS
jgi:hypothetical protein